ncbi:MAG: non-homologous end-joining DNA ligase, partial [Actinomycetota bacterium]|nr:non-homologous end-joining DNA ligase [Actinomycetota bacterium]
MPASAQHGEPVEFAVGERTVRITSPERVYFSARGETKLDLVRYYASVGEGIVRALRERPCMLHRFPGGVDGKKVHQKRLPSGAPDWIDTVRVHFPRYGRHADELCVTESAAVIWAVQMSTVEFHPWNSRRADTERPDEWRIDIDPMPDCKFATVQRVAHVAREVLDELGAVGWPKTSGAAGIHVYVRIEPDFGFQDVRRAALAFAREVERRAPGEATTTWWRKDREPDKAFVDYNQNARDHTIASAYSVRGVSEGTVSTPITWEE